NEAAAVLPDAVPAESAHPPSSTGQRADLWLPPEAFHPEASVLPAASRQSALPSPSACCHSEIPETDVHIRPSGSSAGSLLILLYMFDLKFVYQPCYASFNS